MAIADNPPQLRATHTGQAVGQVCDGTRSGSYLGV
jgi:hypothetical protein